MTEKGKPGKRISRERIAKIEGILLKSKASTVKELADMTGYDRRSVKAIIEKLKKEGKIQVIDDKSPTIIPLPRSP